MPYVSVMQPVLKPKIKISTPQRPTLGTNGLTQSPRKRKVVPIKSSVSVMPFAEKNTTGSFTPLGLGVDAGRGGIRGIGTGGAMPFRKLGQRRVPRPVRRGYDHVEEGSWLSEMLKKAKSRKQTRVAKGLRRRKQLG